MSGRVLRRIGSWLLAAVSLLAVINLGARVQSFDDSQDKRTRAFEIDAEPGEEVRARTFIATVLSVRGAHIIADKGLNHETSGVWLIVKMRATSIKEPTSIAYAVLRDDRGRLFSASGRVRQAFDGGRPLQPGVRVQGEIAFEIPRDAAEGDLTVMLGEAHFYPALDSLVAVTFDRPTPAEVEQWVTDPKAAVLDQPTVQS